MSCEHPLAWVLFVFDFGCLCPPLLVILIYLSLFFTALRLAVPVFIIIIIFIWPPPRDLSIARLFLVH